MTDLDFTLLEDYAAQLNRREAARAGTSMMLGGGSPNAATEALEISRTLGVPPMAVVANPERFRAEVGQFRNTTALTNAPVTRGWVDHDALNAMLAQDDLDGLSGFERTAAEMARSVEALGDVFEETQAGRGVRTGGLGVAQMTTALGTIPVSSQLQRDAATLGYLGQLQEADPNMARHEVAALIGVDANSMTAAIAYDFLVGDEDRRQQHVDRLLRRITSNDEAMAALVDAVNSYSAQMQETQGRMPNFTDIRDVGDFADWLSFNTGQAIPYMAATFIAGALGGAPGVVGAGYSMGVGDIQSGLIEEGITDQGGVALVGGIPYAGLELLGPAARPFRGVGGDVLQEVAEGYLRRLGREAGESAVEEFINEAGQEIIRDYAVQAGGGEEVVLNNETLLRWFNSGMAGLAGGTVMAAATVSPVQRDIERADEAGGTADLLDQVDAAVAQTQLRGRSPERFLDFANQTGAGQQLLFVPADGLREYAQARDMTDEDLEAWGVDVESLDQLAPSGGVVSVPMSNYAAMISGTEDAAWFRENATTREDEMSLAEAMAFNDQVQEIMQEAFDEAERQRLSDEELRASDVQIYDQVFSQLRAAGRSPDVAQNEARVWAAFWTTMGERYGEDPLDLARSMGVQFQGEMTPQVTRRRTQLDVMMNELRRRGDAALRPRGMSILDFVMSEGGVMDPGGEVAMLDGPAGLISETADQIAERRSQPNMLGPVGETGTTLEDMARRVAEAGYWPDLMGIVAEGNPDTELDLSQRLLDALSGELAGERTYLDGEGPDANLTQLAEALSERGIDLADVTNDEAVAALERGRDGREYGQDGRLITDSPEFRAWFGDSKVVDENGDPLVVYHGTGADIEAFNPGMSGRNSDSGFLGTGIYFSNRGDIASAYTNMAHNSLGSPNVMPVYLSMQNPFMWGEKSQGVRGLVMRGERLPEQIHDEVIQRTGFEFDPNAEPGFAMERILSDAIRDVLIDQGYDGVVASFNGQPGEFVAFSPEQIKSVFNRGTFDPNDPRILYQGEETRRGSIVLPSGGVTQGQTVINLFENADLSTVLHESGHFFYEAFEALASQDSAPQAMKTDLATLQTWMGVKPGERPSVEAHERMARGFERYLMEGKAPSIDLAMVFSRFKAWLTRIYRTVRGLNIELTDEVREVFDRMLATDEAIAEAKAEASMRPLFREAPAGMSDVDFRAYQRLGQKAEARAEQSLLERTMEKVRRRKEAWWREERKATEAEVTESVNRRRAYRLVELLANQRWIGAQEGQDIPDMRIDRAELVEMFGDGVLQEISRQRLGGKRAIYGEDGSSPGEVAQFFGYANAMEMIEELQNAGKRKEVIRSETDRLMEERHGDPLNDGSIEAEAMDAIHSIQQGEVIAAEVRQLARQRGQDGGRINNRVFRYRAQQMIARMSVRDASRPQTFLAAERKAARTAERAFAKVARGGRGAERALAEAYQAKEQQLLNHHLYAEAREVERLVERGRERMRAYEKATVRKRLEGGYIEQIDALLDRFDFRRRSPGQIRRSESLRDFMDRMIAEGREAELAIPEGLADEARRVHYTRLSVEELRGLFDAVANLDHMGRFKQKLIDRQKARDLAQSAGTVAQQIRDNLGTGRAKQESRVRNTFNLLWTTDTMLVEMDGLDEFGPAYREIKQAIDVGQAEEQRLSVELAERLDQLFSVYSAKELREMQTARVRDGVNAKAWSKLEILSVALNTGNADNLQRLLADDAHPDVRMDRDQLDALLSNMDKRDWDFVQSMWDLIDGYWPEIRDVTKRRTGVVPGKVEASPVVTPYGTYRGGYYPIKYDPGLSANANLDDRSAFDDFVSAGRHGKAQTANGHTIKRKQSGNGRTLMLDMNVAFSHLRDVVRDIALSEAVDNSYRILNHPEVLNAFIDAGRQGDHRVLNLWLKDTAKGPIYNTDTINSLARMTKNNFTLSRLAFNMKTVALQATGVAQSAATVGKRAMLRGFQEYLKRPRALAQEVMEASPFMAERQSTFQKDIYDFANDVKVASPLSSRWANAKSAVSKVGFAPIVKMQFYAVDLPTWLAGYNVGLERFGNEAEAIQYADRMVARSQDSGLMGDRNAVSRGTVSETTRQSDFIRLFTTLAGYMMTKMNRANITIRRGAKGMSEGSTAERIAAAANMATDLMMLYVAEALMMALMYGLMTDEEEPDDYARFIGREVGAAIFGGVPFVRDAASAFSGYGGGGVYGSVLEIPSRLYTQVVQGENDRSLRRAIGDVVGVATGLPTTATLRGMEWVAAPDQVSPAEALFGSNPLTR